MTDDIDEQVDEGTGEESGDADSLIDLLSGEEIAASPKNRLIQKVLRQLIESYGFDRKDLRTSYRLTTQGNRGKSVDIAILRHGQGPQAQNVERIVVCETQKPREKLRSVHEAAGDLRKLHQKLELLPSCHLGMWTNGHEEFFVRAQDTTFETRFTNIGAWPAPGERTDDVLREGGATQVAADPEDLEAALSRCHRYLTKNLMLGSDAFKPLGALLLAKLHDETRPVGERRFWIRGDEPFTADGQAAIQRACDHVLQQCPGLAGRSPSPWMGLGAPRRSADGSARDGDSSVLARGQPTKEPDDCIPVGSPLYDGWQGRSLSNSPQRGRDGGFDARPYS